MSRKHSTTQVTVREASRGSEASETTPLVPSDVDPDLAQAAKSWFPPIAKVLFTSFLLSMTFAFTQTSLIYSFRTMTCDEYYKTHPSPEMDLLGGHGNGDRCAVPAIESSTARSIALMGSTTTASTIINLFVTGYWIKRFGVKAAMFQQTAWAAGRNLCQIYSLHLGGAGGIRIIQITQLFNIMGSGGGYMLASNAFIAILADADKRTSLFGVLGGIAMLGASAGYTFGGLTEYFFGPIAPFQVTFCLLVFCTIFGSIFLPHIRPGANSSNSPGKKSQSFLAPLKIFIPRRVTDERGSRRDWNLFLVGLGAFFSVLATGYVPLGLQLVATNVFGFKPAESGAMLSLTLLVKAFFLSICFPVIISRGRRWVSGHRTALSYPHPARKLSSSSSTSSSSTHPPNGPKPTSSSSSTLTAVDRSDYGSIDPHTHPDQPLQAQEPNVSTPPTLDQPPRSTDQAHGSLFDLHFLRWSIFLDGILTACVSWSSAGWHMYLAAAILPFASGTGSACKGVTLDFVDEHDRGDALGAIALVEKLAQVLTVGIFGTIFSALSEAEKPTMVFLANAVVAMLGFGFLLFVKLPTPRLPASSA